MYIHLYALCRVPEWLIDEYGIQFDEHGVAVTDSVSDFDWWLETVLERYRTEDNYWQFNYAVLEDNRIIVCRERLSDPPVSFDEAFRLAENGVRYSLYQLLSLIGEQNAVSEPLTPQLFDSIMSRVVPSRQPYAFKSLAQMAYACHYAERYPFSHAVSTWEHWPALDITEYVERDSGGPLAVLVWSVHV